MILMLILTNCTSKLDFDGFDPVTSTLKWVIKHERN